MNTTQALIGHQAGEAGAIRAVIAALIATHPDPKRLREAIAASSTAEMTALAIRASGSESEGIKQAFHKALSVFIGLIPRSSKAKS